jgi:hypothetical protein
MPVIRGHGVSTPLGEVATGKILLYNIQTMDNKTSLNPPRIWGALLFWFGILVGILLYTVIAWANFEAVFYGFAKLSSEQLGTLRCPLLMTVTENGIVSAEFANPRDKLTQVLVRADISTPNITRREQELLSIAPGETKRLEWTVNAENVDLRYFIFVKAYQYPSYISRTREATCGIFVLPLPFVTGNQAFIVILATSLLGILAGLALWERSASHIDKRDIEISRAMKVLAVVVLAGMFFSFQGNWPGSLLTLAIAILLIAAILFFVLGR